MGLDRQAAAARASAGEEPTQALAGALDVRRRSRRGADEQRRRARPARRRHLPQALPRQPLPARGTHDRTAALGRPNLPPAAPLALRYLSELLAAKARGDPIPALALA